MILIVDIPPENLAEFVALCAKLGVQIIDRIEQGPAGGNPRLTLVADQFAEVVAIAASYFGTGQGHAVVLDQEEIDLLYAFMDFHGGDDLPEYLSEAALTRLHDEKIGPLRSKPENAHEPASPETGA